MRRRIPQRGNNKKKKNLSLSGGKKNKSKPTKLNLGRHTRRLRLTAHSSWLIWFWIDCQEWSWGSQFTAHLISSGAFSFIEAHSQVGSQPTGPPRLRLTAKEPLLYSRLTAKEPHSQVAVSLSFTCLFQNNWSSGFDSRLINYALYNNMIAFVFFILTYFLVHIHAWSVSVSSVYIN